MGFGILVWEGLACALGGISQYAWSPCQLPGALPPTWDNQKNVSRYFYISLCAESPLDDNYLPRVILTIGQVSADL